MAGESERTVKRMLPKTGQAVERCVHGGAARAQTRRMGLAAIAPGYEPATARLVLAGFLGTFLIARIVVLLIMTRAIPTLYLRLGSTHVHHLNYGIVLLSVVGGYLVLARPTGTAFQVATLVYAVGLALTYDEFGMWVHLGGPYWQRASLDAVTVIASALLLIAVAPDWRSFQPHHWATAAVLAAALVAFSVLLKRSMRFARELISPALQHIEASGPKT